MALSWLSSYTLICLLILKVIQNATLREEIIVCSLLYPLSIFQNFSYYSLLFPSEYILIPIDSICIAFKLYWMIYLCFGFSWIFYEVFMYMSYIYICLYPYRKLSIIWGRKVCLKPSLGQPLNLEANTINLQAYFLTWTHSCIKWEFLVN